MLGHQLFKSLGEKHDVRVTLRQRLDDYKEFNLFNSGYAYTEIDVQDRGGIGDVLADFKPEAVINGIGIVKQRSAARESLPSIEINALFPHRLSVLCRDIGTRLVHMSTDCVFSGKKGGYIETDPSDAEDLYGRTKFLGEIHDANTLTLRTSIIGRELLRKSGLLEWFLAQRKEVKGFKKATFSGFTTLEMSRIIGKILVDYTEASGVYHVSSQPINKFDLLTLIKEKMYLDIEIVPDENVQCDRSLDSTRFKKEFGYTPPSWDAMIEELGQRT